MAALKAEHPLNGPEALVADVAAKQDEPAPDSDASDFPVDQPAA